MRGFGRVLGLLAVFLAIAAGVAIALTAGFGPGPNAPAGGGEAGLGDLVWYVAAGLTVVSAAVTAFHRNVLYAGFALLGAFGGVAALFVWLSADFLAVTQVAVYIGGILVLILFAVMLTSRIDETEGSNPSIGLPVATTLGAVLLGLLVFIALRMPWETVPPGPLSSTFEGIGHALLQEYLLPFEVASVVLLAVLIGAVIIVRKEARPEE